MRIGVLLALLPICLTASLAAQQPPPPPTLTFTPSTVTVSGVTSGGKVAWIEVARQIDDMFLRLVRKADVTVDTDTNGSVSIEPDDGVPPQSVWLAVDMATGAFVSGAPSSFPILAAQLPLSAIATPLEGGGDAVKLDRPQIEILVVRPSVGAWVSTVGDGGPSDSDQLGNGAVEVAVEVLDPLGDTHDPAAANLAAGDLIVVVDSTTLDVFTLVLGVSQ